jgi:hypothetical protein
LGPLSREAKPGYIKGLLGGLWTLAAAPVAFAAEEVQAVALTPVRMMKGLKQGDPFAILEPLRTAKNFALDSLFVGVGMANSAAAPVWSAIDPASAPDFMLANDRLIFEGGPLSAATRDVGVAAFTASWHTVFTPRELPGDQYQHEFVHSDQIARSFLWEHTGD